MSETKRTFEYPNTRVRADLIERQQKTIEDYERYAKDVRRLTRELDVFLSGEDNAAEQASLCDLVALGRDMHGEITRLTQDLKEARDRIAKLEARLEIDHVWVSQGGGPMERVEIPPEKRDEQIDGIECRDETIKLARARIEEVAKEARERLDELVKAAEPFVKIVNRCLLAYAPRDDRDGLDIVVSVREARSLSEAVARAKKEGK